MPTLEGPCPPCKIIINGGFMAALAPLLASHATSDAVSDAATRLTEIANAHANMLTTLGIGMKVAEEWEGCDQARSLVDWIDRADNLGDVEDDDVVQDMVSQLNAWADELWSAISDLADGKVPKLT